MTDLRDQLAADIAADPAVNHWAEAQRLADRILAAGWRPGTPPRTRNHATCHPDRPVEARSLCKPCYQTARENGRLHEHHVKHRIYRSTAEVVDLIELTAGEGVTDRQLADRLGMTVNAFQQSRRRAIRAGLLTPDRRTTA